MITYTINGTATNIETAYHCKVFRVDSDTAPARDENYIEIPGRSGDIIIDNGRYPNVEMRYTAIFYEPNGNVSADANAQNLRNALLSQRGYQRLTDTEHSGEFYLAAVSEEIEPYIVRDRSASRLEITFKRKPQRYLTNGETATTYTANFTISNPTMFDAKPKLEVQLPSGITYGQLVIASKTIRIYNPNAKTIIDSEMQDCYYSTTNLNSKVTFSDYNFPVFKRGNTAVTLTNVTSVKVTPNWWRL